MLTKISLESADAFYTLGVTLYFEWSNEGKCWWSVSCAPSVYYKAWQERGEHNHFTCPNFYVEIDN